MTSCGSVPGTRRATSTFITSSPRGQLPLAFGGDPEGLLRAVFAVSVGLDHTVALEPLQCRVDLAHVQRPDLAGPALELLTELQPVLGSLAQQREHRIPDAHELRLLGIILGSILSIVPGDK